LDEAKGRAFDLLPGVYDLKVKGPDDQVKEQKGIDIKSGRTKSVAIEFYF
jgi:hypothetical protein